MLGVSLRMESRQGRGQRKSEQGLFMAHQNTAPVLPLSGWATCPQMNYPLQHRTNSPSLRGKRTGLGAAGKPNPRAKMTVYLFIVCLIYRMGFPHGASGKESACQCRRHRRCRFDPWIGKIPWRRKWQPTPVFLPGKSHGGL